MLQVQKEVDRFIKEESVDSDDGALPPKLEAEKLTGEAEEEENDVGSSNPKLVKTLADLLKDQYDNSDDKEKSPESDISEPPPKLSVSEFSAERRPSTSSSSNNTSAFLEVVGRNYIVTPKVANLRQTRSTGKRTHSPAQSSTPSSSSKRSTRLSVGKLGLTQILQNQEPIRVDVQVGSGSPPETSLNFHAGQTSSSSNDHADNSAMESTPSPNGFLRNAAEKESNEEYPENLRNALRNCGLPEKIAKETSTHNMLIGCMVMNGLNTLTRQRGGKVANFFRDDLFAIFKKYNIHSETADDVLLAMFAKLLALTEDSDCGELDGGEWL
ncbi:unnamed protein product [Caenorhabditis angaria]|uniref:Uncharacterized protein n=1 Tax=Caenorhabditis angaria TaxID=860376 RepID=A0A9P1IIM7_9PELO|nr:unnamed protein product [Caenorhabditis angaria]